MCGELLPHNRICVRSIDDGHRHGPNDERPDLTEAIERTLRIMGADLVDGPGDDWIGDVRHLRTLQWLMDLAQTCSPPMALAIYGGVERGLRSIGAIA